METLVHFDRLDMPDSYQLLSIELPDERIETYFPGEVALSDFASTQRYGDSWLTSGNAPALRVESVVAPHSYNYLLNPTHPDIKWVRILASERWPFDPRLIA